MAIEVRWPFRSRMLVERRQIDSTVPFWPNIFTLWPTQDGLSAKMMNLPMRFSSVSLAARATARWPMPTAWWTRLTGRWERLRVSLRWRPIGKPGNASPKSWNAIITDNHTVGSTSRGRSTSSAVIPGGCCGFDNAGSSKPVITGKSKTCGENNGHCFLHPLKDRNRQFVQPAKSPVFCETGQCK